MAAAVLAVPLARRLGLGSALGYLMAGVVIGPHLLGLVGEEGQDVLHFAEFGVVLMLFLVGLELRPSLLWRLRVPILGLGGAQVVVTAAVITLAAWLLGLTWQAAVAIGMTLSLSSTAMVLQTLDEKGWLATQAGKGGFSVLLFQDIAVIPMLAAMPFLADSGQVSLPDDGGRGWTYALLVLGVVAAIVIGGRFLTRPVFRWIAASRSSEVFIATALLLVIGISLAMDFVDLSPALGTFLAGVVLAESEYRHELEANIEPFKGLLLGLFFIAVGASIDFGLVAESPGLVMGLVLLLIGIKFPLLLLLGKLFRLTLADNLMFAFVLAQGGEFAFLLFSFATQTRVLDAGTTNLMIVVVALSMVLTPLMIIFYERWVRPRFINSVQPPEDTDIDASPAPVIIAGFGRFGQVVARLLRAAGVETVLLDHDASQIELTARFGNKVFYGDAGRVDLLRAAGAEKAKLLVVAFSSRKMSVDLVKLVKMHFPRMRVLARSYDRAHTYALMEAGADGVIRETFGSALITGEQALKLLGFDSERATRAMRMFRQHDEAGLKKMYEVWGDDQAYGIRIREELDQLEKVLQDDLNDPQS
ncbi:monovalent cation:proton antiporter-2 (CPA2) family protein [Elongatibacter sediminis]|uniref:Monovalent cation:proton antiporter-2 (CPA2) family protein n=1 Tax=Elongatibacter sediminis TaxID=3119006 RepID=A0AAW9RJ65_9GAMM